MTLKKHIVKLKLNLIVEAILNKKISHWALLAFVGIDLYIYSISFGHSVTFYINSISLNVI